jgi:hypothetical protein
MNKRELTSRPFVTRHYLTLVFDREAVHCDTVLSSTRSTLTERIVIVLLV